MPPKNSKPKHTKACELGDNHTFCPACCELEKERKSKKGNPLEKVIEQKVCDHAKQLGCLVYKFTSPARRSVPDRLFIMPGGKGSFFIEFKRKGAQPTEAQKIEIAKIRAQGTRVFVIDDATAGKCCVADMVHGVALEDYSNHQATEPRSPLGPLPKISFRSPTMEDPAFN